MSDPRTIPHLVSWLPRFTAAINAVASDEARHLLAVDTKQAGAVWERLAPLQEAIERLQHSLKQVAHSRPLPLSNGKMLAAIENHREVLDADVAHQVIIDLGFEQVRADEAMECSVKVTKASIRRAIGDSKASAEILKRIRSSNGSKEAYYYTESEVSPDEVTFNPDGSIRRDIDGKSPPKE